MKLKTIIRSALPVITALIGVFAAGLAQAGTINFSGHTWTTYDRVFTQQYSPGQTNDYVATDANTGTMTARFGTLGGDDTYMTTPVSPTVDSWVRYGYFLTEDARDFGGDGSSTYVGDSRTGFQNSSGNWVSGRIATYSSRWEHYFEGNNPAYVFKARGYPWKIHVLWLFHSTTNATVILTLDGETTPFATWPDTFSNLADITQFRAGLWDSEQDVVVTDFIASSAPLILTQPQAPTNTLYTGQSFSLSVTAFGPSLFYQWRKDNTDLPGANSATFNRTNINTGDSGNYDVVITNSSGSVTSSVASITVNSETAPFNVVVSPASASRCEGSAITFTVTADGTTPFTYQWYKGFSLMPGETNSTLTLSPLVATDSEVYYCSVSNVVGSTLSSGGSLAVGVCPPGTVGINFSAGGEIVTAPAFGVDTANWHNPSGATGDNQTFGSLTLSWFSSNPWNQGTYPPAPGNDEVLYGYLDDGAGGNSVTISELNSVFTVYVVQAIGASDNAGSFQNVTITNGSQTLSYPSPQPNGSGGLTGLSTASAPLSDNTIKLQGLTWVGVARGSLAGIIITDKPVLEVQPQGPTNTLYTGGSFSLTGLGVIGVPTLAYQWRKDGTNISGANSATYSKSGITTADSGNYDVVVTNSYGSVTSSIVVITVNDAPPSNIVVTPAAQTRYETWSATFTVTADGSQPFTYQWKKGITPIPGANASTLTLSSLTTNDSGSYSCTVSNSAGFDTSANATLTVVPLPSGYVGQVLTDQPLAYYRLNQPAVAVNSGSVGSSGDGAYNPGIVRSAEGALAGSADTAASFSLALAQPVLIPNNPALNTSVFTVETWVKPTIEGLANAGSPLMNRVSDDGASGRQGWVFFQRAANGQTPPDANGSGFNFRMYKAGTTSTAINITGGSYNTNEWTHLAASFDGTTARLYVNGAEVTSGITDGVYAPNTLQSLGIGAWSEIDFGTIYQNPFEGSIDEVALYTNVLSGPQILAHYENGTNALRSTPYEQLITATNNAAGYYRLNEPDALNTGTLGAVADGGYVRVTDYTGAGTPGYQGLEADNLAKGFNGTNSYIGLGNPAGLNFAGAISLEAWIQPGAVQGTWADVIAHGVNSADNGEVMLRLQDVGTVFAIYQAGSWDGVSGYNVSYSIPAEDLTGTNWVHLVGTYDGANWNLYRNGSLVASNPGAGGSLLVNDANWAIGASGGYPAFTQGFRGYSGGIDEPAIYNAALSAARVQAHYFMGKYGSLTPPAPTLTISRSGANVTLIWSAGTLQQADTVTGPYTDVPGATSPYEVPASEAKKFYRARL